MIDVVDLWKSFGENDVLKGISLTIGEGETYVVLGGSGSGKTVLMKHVIGLFKPDRGHVLVDGANISSLEGKPLNEARRAFGMVFQGAALFDSMTVFENVAFPLMEKSHRDRPPPDEVRTRVIEKLKVVDLGEEVLERWPAELSGGMRKRVGLARALVTDPKIVLYDEPTTGLDPIMQREFLALVAEAQAEGRTVFLSSHNLTEVERACDRVGIIRGGELVRSGPVRELLGGHARSVHLVIDDGQDLRALEMPGVRVVSRRGRDAQLLVHGDVNPLIRRLGTLDIRDITITTPDIEEVFLRLYEGPTERASVDPVRDRHPLEVTR